MVLSPVSGGYRVRRPAMCVYAREEGVACLIHYTSTWVFSKMSSDPR